MIFLPALLVVLNVFASIASAKSVFAHVVVGDTFSLSEDEQVPPPFFLSPPTNLSIAG